MPEQPYAESQATSFHCVRGDHEANMKSPEGVAVYDVYDPQWRSTGRVPQYACSDHLTDVENNILEEFTSGDLVDQPDEGSDVPPGWAVEQAADEIKAGMGGHPDWQPIYWAVRVRAWSLADGS